ELRGSLANGRMPYRDDSFAAASRTGFADGQTGDAARRAASRERGAMKKDSRFVGSAADTKNVGRISAHRDIGRYMDAVSNGRAMSLWAEIDRKSTRLNSSHVSI